MESVDWHSLLARQLLTETQSAVMEDALIARLDRTLSIFGTPKYPIDLPLVASVFGIEPKFKYVEMAQAGRLVRLDGKYHIEVNKAHPNVRKRFSIAHEIGHKAILTSKIAVPKERISYNPDIETGEEEEICDLFATMLLGLRPTFISETLGDRGCSLATVDFLAKYLDVSFEAVIRAIACYGQIPAIFLYCLPAAIGNNEIFYVQRYYVTRRFPYTLLGRTILPHYNCLKRAWLGQGTARTVEHWQNEFGLGAFCIFEARRMPIYVEDSKKDGLVVAVIAQ
jgi:hypothetical protein